MSDVRMEEPVWMAPFPTAVHAQMATGDKTVNVS